MLEEDDPFVPVWEGPTPEAQALLERLERAHVPVDLGEALSVGEARVEVPRSYVEEARAVMASEPVPELPRLDWTPLIRVGLVVVAALVIFGMVISLVR